MKEALSYISTIAENMRKIHRIELGDEYSLRDEVGDDTLWYEIESLLDDNAVMKTKLENHGYNPDECIKENLAEIIERKGCITPQDILEATKLSESDKRCYVKFSTVTDSRISVSHCWIYLDPSYNNEEGKIQDIVNTCWGIAEFFGGCLKEILDYRMEA